MPRVAQNSVLFSTPNRSYLMCCPCLGNHIKGGCQVCQLLPLANRCCILSYFLVMSLFSYSVFHLSNSLPWVSFLQLCILVRSDDSVRVRVTSSLVLKYRCGTRIANGVSCYLNLDLFKVLLK